MEIAKEISKHINAKQILYALSDNGSNIIKAVNKLNIKHIEDINHKFSWIIQKVFESNADFKSYTK
jgi:hypothetical protein